MILISEDDKRLIRFQSLSKYPNFYQADGIAITKDEQHISGIGIGFAHYHDYYEFEYISAGEGFQWINGYTYVVKKGDVIFFRLRDAHEYGSFRGMDVVNCCFHPDVVPEMKFLENDAMGAVVVHLTEEAQREFEQLLSLLQKECAQKKEYRAEATRHYLHLLIIFLKRTGYMSKNDGILWNELLRFFFENYQTVTLDEAAAFVHVTKNYFCRAFRQTTGMTFLSYITNLRINAAKTLLISTDMSVVDIWDSVGFSQAKHFYHAFRRETGCTPTAFRSQYKQGHTQ